MRSISLNQVFVAASRRLVVLPGELVGYLVLGLVEELRERDATVQLEAVQLAEDGRVFCSAAPPATGDQAQLRVVRVLELLLGVSSAVSPGLRRACAGGNMPEGNLKQALESALIPLNRAAARRALARLVREVLRLTATGAVSSTVAPEVASPAPIDVPQALPFNGVAVEVPDLFNASHASVEGVPGFAGLKAVTDWAEPAAQPSPLGRAFAAPGFASGAQSDGAQIPDLEMPLRADGLAKTLVGRVVTVPAVAAVISSGVPPQGTRDCCPPSARREEPEAVNRDPLPNSSGEPRTTTLVMSKVAPVEHAGELPPSRLLQGAAHGARTQMSSDTIEEPRTTTVIMAEVAPIGEPSAPVAPVDITIALPLVRKKVCAVPNPCALETTLDWDETRVDAVSEMIEDAPSNASYPVECALAEVPNCARFVDSGSQDAPSFVVDEVDEGAADEIDCEIDFAHFDEVERLNGEQPVRSSVDSVDASPLDLTVIPLGSYDLCYLPSAPATAECIIGNAETRDLSTIVASQDAVIAASEPILHQSSIGTVTPTFYRVASQGMRSNSSDAEALAAKLGEEPSWLSPELSRDLRSLAGLALTPMPHPVETLTPPPVETHTPPPVVGQAALVSRTEEPMPGGMSRVGLGALALICLIGVASMCRHSMAPSAAGRGEPSVNDLSNMPIAQLCRATLNVNGIESGANVRARQHGDERYRDPTRLENETAVFAGLRCGESVEVLVNAAVSQIFERIPVAADQMRPHRGHSVVSATVSL